MAEGGDEGEATGVHSGMPDVFISYASQDTAVANAIVEILEGNDLQCWIAPRDVTPGSHYADGIISAISGAKALVLVLSGSALTSKHVGKEVERASSKGRAIIAIHTDAAPLTPAFEYFLSESQWIGAGGLAAVAAKLVEAVRSQAGSTVPTDPAAERMVAGRSRAAAIPRIKPLRPPGGGRSASPIELLGGRRGGGRRLMLFLVLVGGGGGLPGTLRRSGINRSLILFWANSRRARGLGISSHGSSGDSKSQ